MNERIKQLAEQAMVTNNRGDGYYNRILDPEKFAELLLRDAFTIIKEAVLEGDESQMDDMMSARIEDAAYDVVDAYGIVNAIYEG